MNLAGFRLSGFRIVWFQVPRITGRFQYASYTNQILIFVFTNHRGRTGNVTLANKDGSSKRQLQTTSELGQSMTFAHPTHSVRASVKVHTTPDGLAVDALRRQNTTSTAQTSSSVAPLRPLSFIPTPKAQAPLTFILIALAGISYVT